MSFATLVHKLALVQGNVELACRVDLRFIICLTLKAGTQKQTHTACLDTQASSSNKERERNYMIWHPIK